MRCLHQFVQSCPCCFVAETAFAAAENFEIVKSVHDLVSDFVIVVDSAAAVDVVRAFAGGADAVVG